MTTEQSTCRYCGADLAAQPRHMAADCSARLGDQLSAAEEALREALRRERSVYRQEARKPLTAQRLTVLQSARREYQTAAREARALYARLIAWQYSRVAPMGPLTWSTLGQIEAAAKTAERGDTAAQAQTALDMAARCLHLWTPEAREPLAAYLASRYQAAAEAPLDPMPDLAYGNVCASAGYMLRCAAVLRCMADQTERQHTERTVLALFTREPGNHALRTERERLARLNMEQRRRASTEAL